MKKIIYIAPDISAKGGISTVISGYLNAQLSQKYNIILVGSHVDGLKVCKLIKGITGLLKTIYYLTIKHIDIVHIHGGDIISLMRKYIYFRLVKLFKCRVIYHFHGASFLEQYPRVSSEWKKRIKQLLEGADLVICLSDSWKKSILQIAPKSKLKVIFNSVSLPVLENQIQKERGIINITFLGLIGERKGVFDLLEVVSRLIKLGLRIHLSVGGNGDIDRLYADIERKGLKDYVTYLGWIVGNVKDKLLRNTDIFVLPSYGEGMPMSILEAMSYGIPVVSTPIGGIPELIIDGVTGYMVKPGDIDGFFKKLLLLISDDKIRRNFGNSGRKVIEEKYNIENTIKLIDDIYRSI